MVPLVKVCASTLVLLPETRAPSVEIAMNTSKLILYYHSAANVQDDDKKESHGTSISGAVQSLSHRLFIPGTQLQSRSLRWSTSGFLEFIVRRAGRIWRF